MRRSILAFDRVLLLLLGLVLVVVGVAAVGWQVGFLADVWPDVPSSVEVDTGQVTGASSYAVLAGAVGVVVLIVGFTLAWWAGRRVHQPITSLIKSADRIAQGDYSRPLEVGRRDELGELQAALERIATVDVASLDAHHRFHLAETFIMAGAHDRGLDLLERSVEGFYPYPYMAEHCRFLDPVRDSPRFMAVLARARQQSESFMSRVAAIG